MPLRRRRPVLGAKAARAWVPERAPTRAEIDELSAGDRDLGEVLEDVARVGAPLLLQTAPEAEVTEFGVRERYARGDRARAGSRNGHHEVTVKATAGPVTLQRPKLRGTDERLASRLLGRHVTKTDAWESLVIAGYGRGLFTRDVGCLAVWNVNHVTETPDTGCLDVLATVDRTTHIQWLTRDR
jgi:hypothetical protein